MLKEEILIDSLRKIEQAIDRIINCLLYTSIKFHENILQVHDSNFVASSGNQL